MYFILAVLAMIIGICLFTCAKRVTQKKAVIICCKIVGIALIAVGLFMLYLVFSGKVVLPLSNG